MDDLRWRCDVSTNSATGSQAFFSPLVLCDEFLVMHSPMISIRQRYYQQHGDKEGDYQATRKPGSLPKESGK